MVALALVERAQGLAGDDRGAPRRSGIHRDFRPVQRQALALDRGRQLDLAGRWSGDRWRGSRGDHWWLAGLRRLPGFRDRGRRGRCDQSRAQVPAVFTASGHTTFEQPVVVGANGQRLCLHKGGGAAGGAVTGLDDLNTVLRRRRASAVEVVDEQLSRTTHRATADHQAVRSGAITGKHAVQAQGAVVAGVVALDSQAPEGIVAPTQIDSASVYNRSLVISLDTDNAALVADERAARIDVQGPRARGGDYPWLARAQVTQFQGVVEGQLAALSQVDGLPVDVQSALTDLSLLERQRVRASAAVQGNC
ncbi:hypothetical protein D3C79_653230 [compost metagenome]